MMSDALTAASMISGDMAFYRLMDGLTAACARRNYENEIAYVQACNEWLARNLKRVCAANSTLVETANAREADYRRRIADLERQVADLDAKYKERDAQAVQEASRSRDDYSWLVEKHKNILSNYRTLLMSVPPSTLSGSLLGDYNAVTQMARERE